MYKKMSSQLNIDSAREIILNIDTYDNLKAMCATSRIFHKVCSDSSDLRVQNKILKLKLSRVEQKYNDLKSRFVTYTNEDVRQGLTDLRMIAELLSNDYKHTRNLDDETIHNYRSGLQSVIFSILNNTYVGLRFNIVVNFVNATNYIRRVILNGHNLGEFFRYYPAEPFRILKTINEAIRILKTRPETSAFMDVI
jgi:hypothetical protein